MKCGYCPPIWGSSPVAPLAGAWIEIAKIATHGITFFVAPLAGAWIEINSANAPGPMVTVAPLAGAWIEIK